MDRKPKIGDIVIYHPLPDDSECRLNNAEVVPAIVIQVWDDHCLNLNCIPDCGTQLVPRTSVSDLADENSEGYYWSWPE